MDETWEPKAPEKLREALKDQKMVTVRMAHVWEKGENKFVTMDWASERDRIFNLKHNWGYLHKVVAGPTLLDEMTPTMQTADIWMIHWGYSTAEKRKAHKIRWDLNHGHSVGKNPYGMWKTINELGYEPKLTDYQKFIKML